MVRKIDEVPDENEEKAAHGGTQYLVHQRQFRLLGRFDPEHPLQGGAHCGIDHRKYEGDEKDVKPLLIDGLVYQFEPVDETAHHMGHQESDGRFQEEHLIEIGRFPVAERQVKENVHQYECTPAEYLAKPVI